MTAAIVFAVFTGARILHSVCYVKAIQPWRTVLFAISALDQVVVLGLIGYYVFIAHA